MNLHLHPQPPMTPRQRVLIAVTVLLFIAVTGFVIGCDSDDGPKVTAPSDNGGGGGGGGGGGATPSTQSVEQGKDCSSTTDDEYRNTCSKVSLNVGFSCSRDTITHHYRINPGGTMPRIPISCPGGTGNFAFPCGDPGVARAEDDGGYQCYTNTGITPVQYDPSTSGPTRSTQSEEEGRRCLSVISGEYRNTCSTTVNIGFGCSLGTITHYYRINPGGRITSPLSCRTGPGPFYATCAAPGVPQFQSGTRYRCYINTGITPVVYTGTPTTPTTPQPSSLYGSIAVGRDSQGRRSSISYGRTRSEARTNARSYACRGTVTVCKSIEFGRGQCAALAVGEGGGEAGAGFAVSNTRQAAQNSALEACRNTGATNCRIATDNDGEAFSSCLTSSSTQSSVREQSGVF